MSPCWVEERATMIPIAALDRSSHCVGRCSVGKRYRAVNEVLIDVSADECVHLVTDARAAPAHASISRRGPGVSNRFPPPWRPLSPPVRTRLGQDRPWYQVLGEGRCLGCSWARRMAASSIFDSWQQHPCRSPRRPLHTSHERGTSP